MLRRLRAGIAPYLFLAPNLALFAVFVAIPAIYGFWLSAYRTSPYSPAEFVGLGNFEYLFTRDDVFGRAVRNMVLFVAGDVALILVLSVGIALLLNRRSRLQGLFRSAFFYPVLLSPVVVAMVWQWVLNNRFGILNAALDGVGLRPVPWLLQADWAITWTILVHVWATVGFFALIVLAGLQSIPAVLYEAADVDGATPPQRFLQVTLPLLMPTVLVVLVLSTIRAFEVFDYVFVLTGGGPGFATLMLVQYIYRAGFELDQLGLAAAAAVVLFSILLVLTLLYLWAGRRREAI